MRRTPRTPPVASQHRQRVAGATRRGLSLLEVLISMGVLLIGLLGVAAMIPAGRSEIMQGAKVDHCSMVGTSAFRDLKVRGYLNPANWQDASNAFCFNGTKFINTVAEANSISTLTPVVAIDPLGLAASYGATFPYNAPSLFLTRILPTAYVNTAALADPIFRNNDDLLFTASTKGKDYPPDQQTVPFGSLGPSVLKRASDGNYSWLATVVSDPNVPATIGKVTVSVAVFFKRDVSSAGAGESFATVAFLGGIYGGQGGGEVTLSGFSTTPPKLVRPGQWIMLSGQLTVGANTNKYFRWYRVLSADVDNGGNQNVTLAGPDWNPSTTQTRAWMFDGVVAVYEKNMMLEIP